MGRSHSARNAASIRFVAAGVSLVGASLVATVSAARADAGQTTWTAYLYQGPGSHYSVVGEVPQATSVDVGPCGDGWCQVSFAGRSGYMLSEVVTKGDPAHPEPGVLAQPAAALTAKPAGPCFVVNQKGGNGGNELTSICSK